MRCRARAVRVARGSSETRDAAGGSSRVEAACSRLQAAVRQSVDGGHLTPRGRGPACIGCADCQGWIIWRHSAAFGGTQQLQASNGCNPLLLTSQLPAPRNPAAPPCSPADAAAAGPPQPEPQRGVPAAHVGRCATPRGGLGRPHGVQPGRARSVRGLPRQPSVGSGWRGGGGGGQRSGRM